MAQSLFKLLKERAPDRPVDVLAPAWSLPIVARMPEIREGIAAETTHGELGLAKRRQIGYRLKENDYDRAIVLPRSLKAALVPWFADIPVRTGYRGETRYLLINDTRKLDKSELDQTVKRFAALGLERGESLTCYPCPSLAVDRENQANSIRALGVETDKAVAAMMTGAEYGPAKCWPPEYFAELAARLREQGLDVWLLGSEKDGIVAADICRSSGATNLCGKTSLGDVIDLLAYATLAVSNDSGLMHVAAATGTFVHALYGSSTPDFTPPLTDARCVHYLGLECSPCFQRECPLGHLNCLRDIKPDDVLARIRENGLIPG